MASWILAALLAAPLQNEKLKDLDWLVGSWEGEGKYDDMPFKSTLTYEWTLNNNFIKSTYEAKAGDQVVYADTGMIGWDRDKKKLVWFSFAVDGTIGWGEFDEPKEKDTWIVSGSVQGDDPRFKESRGILKKIDKDSFTDEVQSKKDGKWATFMTTKYNRKKK